MKINHKINPPDLNEQLGKLEAMPSPLSFIKVSEIISNPQEGKLLFLWWLTVFYSYQKQIIETSVDHKFSFDFITELFLQYTEVIHSKSLNGVEYSLALKSYLKKNVSQGNLWIL